MGRLVHVGGSVGVLAPLSIREALAGAGIFDSLGLKTGLGMARKPKTGRKGGCFHAD